MAGGETDVETSGEDGPDRRDRSMSLNLPRRETDAPSRRHTLDVDNEPPEETSSSREQFWTTQFLRESKSYLRRHDGVLTISDDNEQVVTYDPSHVVGWQLLGRRRSWRLALRTTWNAVIVGAALRVSSIDDDVLSETTVLVVVGVVFVLIIMSIFEAQMHRRRLCDDLRKLRCSFDALLLSSTLWFPKLLDLQLDILRLALLTTSLIFAQRMALRNNVQPATTTGEEKPVEDKGCLFERRACLGPGTVEDLERRGLVTAEEKRLLVADASPARQVVQWTGQVLFRAIHQVVNMDATWTAHWEASAKTRVVEHLNHAALAVDAVIDDGKMAFPLLGAQSVALLVDIACLLLALRAAPHLLEWSSLGDIVLLPVLFQILLDVARGLRNPFGSDFFDLPESAVIKEQRHDALGILASARRYRTNRISRWDAPTPLASSSGGTGDATFFPSASAPTTLGRSPSMSSPAPGGTSPGSYASFAQLRESMRRSEHRSSSQ